MLVSIYNLHDTDRTRARRLPVTLPSILVGSDPICDVQIIDDPGVAPRHATITMRPATAELTITPHAGATQVNQRAITATTTFVLGDALRLGDTILKFRPAGVTTSFDPRSSDSRVSTTPPPTNPPAPKPRRPDYYESRTFNPPMPQLPPQLQLPPPPMPEPARIRRVVLSDDPLEQQFLSTLRDTPTDTATRLVYADWLEQRGLTTKAEFVRTEDHLDARHFVTDSDVHWRVITSRTSIEQCRTPAKCPGRWDRLAATPDDDVSRACTSCARRVYFCKGESVLRFHGLRSDPVAFDASLDRIAAHQTYKGFSGAVVTIDDSEQRYPGDTIDTLRDDE